MRKCIQFNTVFLSARSIKVLLKESKIDSSLWCQLLPEIRLLLPKRYNINEVFPRALMRICLLCTHCTSTSSSLDILSEKKKRFLLFFYYFCKQKWLNLKMIFNDCSKDSSYLSIIIALECSNCYSLLLNLTLTGFDPKFDLPRTTWKTCSNESVSTWKLWAILCKVNQVTHKFMHSLYTGKWLGMFRKQLVPSDINEQFFSQQVRFKFRYFPAH